MKDGPEIPRAASHSFEAEREAFCDIYKERVIYSTKLTEVSGILTYSQFFLMFDPTLTDGLATVRLQGRDQKVPVEQCQCYVSMSDVSQCTSIRAPARKLGKPLRHLVLLTTRPGISDERDIHATAQFSFRIKSESKEKKASAAEKQAKTAEVVARINEFRKNTGDVKSGESMLPYYDVVLTQSDREDAGGTEGSTPTLSDSVSSLCDLSAPQSQFLSKSMRHRLRRELPKLYQLRHWQLVYSPPEHGCSLQTFYRNASEYSATLLIVQDEGKRVFGGFISESIRVTKTFYGTGESFLFTFRRKNRLDVFKASFLNEFYVTSDEESISLGSGGAPGLYISHDLVHGSSGCSDTYLNPVLSSTEDFNILNIELWGFI